MIVLRHRHVNGIYWKMLSFLALFLPLFATIAPFHLAKDLLVWAFHTAQYMKMKFYSFESNFVLSISLPFHTFFQRLVVSFHHREGSRDFWTPCRIGKVIGTEVEGYYIHTLALHDMMHKDIFVMHILNYLFMLPSIM